MVLFGIPIRVPFLIVMLLAALWVFALAWWKPELLEQKRGSRFYVSLLEGLVCGLLWGFLLSHFSSDPAASLALSALLTSLVWFCVAFYSRLRYTKTLTGLPTSLSGPKGYRQ